MLKQRLRSQPAELVVYTGPMWSGKTGALNAQLELALISGKRAGFRVLLFMPKKDTRETRPGKEFSGETVRIAHVTEVFDHICEDHLVIGFDEIQFFEEEWEEFKNVSKKLVRSGRHVHIAGLDLDFKENSFRIVSETMALAQQIYKKEAVCDRCGSFHASRSQRISSETDRFVVGDSTEYEARCIDCFEPPIDDVDSGETTSNEIPSAT